MVDGEEHFSTLGTLEDLALLLADARLALYAIGQALLIRHTGGTGQLAGLARLTGLAAAGTRHGPDLQIRKYRFQPFRFIITVFRIRLNYLRICSCLPSLRPVGHPTLYYSCGEEFVPFLNS